MPGAGQTAFLVIEGLFFYRNVSSELEERFPSHQRAAYNPRRTYTRPMLPRSTPSSTARRQPRSIGKTFTRDVVLLSNEEEIVPRGSTRSDLYDEGRIVSMVDFNTSWDEERVRAKVEECFSNFLDMNKPPPRYKISNPLHACILSDLTWTRFTFLKTCGASLKVPNLPANFRWTGERIKVNSNQSCVYVRSLYPLLEQLQEVSVLFYVKV